ncbi:ABC transporter permease [Streptomyces sp. NPDC001492]
MRAVLAIAAKDLRQRLRDRSAWVIVFLAPVLISALMALAFNNNDTFRANLGVVDLDRGPAAAGLTEVLKSPELRGTVHVRSYGAEAAARRAVDAGDVHAAIVVPRGFTASLHGGSAAPVRVLDSVDYGLQAQLARAVTESYVAQVNADRLSVATAVAAGAPHSDIPRLPRRRPC